MRAAGLRVGACLCRPTHLGSPSGRSRAAEGHKIRGDWGHLMLRNRGAPHSEVIRAIVLEGSLCCGGSRTWPSLQLPSYLDSTLPPLPRQTIFPRPWRWPSFHCPLYLIPSERVNNLFTRRRPPESYHEWTARQRPVRRGSGAPATAGRLAVKALRPCPTPNGLRFTPWARIGQHTCIV